ncbi:replicative DNA helicase [Longispora sp. K20-0274]|uniref:replicative DNA helicase n=1 Tax=Longispora sp. K20-0274 TaxID=3088255 RepID=UPI00399BA21D
MTPPVALSTPDAVPPQDVAAEQITLGLMLLSKDAITEAVSVVGHDDFYKPVHVTIYLAILHLWSAGEPADPITVTAALMDAGEADRCGGAPYLHTLISSCPAGASVTPYAQVVAERSVLRRLGEAGHRVVQLAAPGSTMGAYDAVDLAQRVILELPGGKSGGSATALVDLLQPALDAIESAASSGRGAISTGFIDLDRLTGGLAPGQLIVIGGRASIGKSTLAMDFLRSAVFRQGVASLLVSREQSRLEIVERILSAEAGIPLHVLKPGYLADDDWNRLATTMGDMIDAPLFIDTDSRTIDQIRARARRLKKRAGVGLLVVDFIQFFARGRYDRYREMADVSRELKDLGQELDMAVVAVSQLNRGPEARIDKRPELQDLRDSGTIEDDADLVILIHRDDYYDRQSPRAGEADLVVAKQRNGPTDTITVVAQLHLCRFTDMAAGPPFEDQAESEHAG